MEWIFQQSGCLFKAATIIIFVVNSAFTFEGIAPPQPDSSQIQAVLNFIHNKQICELPGSTGSSDQKTCFHPLSTYLQRFREPDNDSEVREPIPQQTSTALYTFHRFCLPDTNSFTPLDPKRFEHGNFLSLLETEEPSASEESFLVRLANIFVMFLVNAVILLRTVLLEPLQELTPPLKLLFAAVGAILFILLSVALSRVAKKLYPPEDTRLSGNHSAQTEHLPTLHHAEELLQTGDVRGSVTTAYKWLVYISDKNNLVKRYEWWTNRQFIALLFKRSPSLGKLGKDVITHYETVVYGHQKVEIQVLKNLIDNCLLKSGKIQGR